MLFLLLQEIFAKTSISFNIISGAILFTILYRSGETEELHDLLEEPTTTFPPTTIQSLSEEAEYSTVAPWIHTNTCFSYKFKGIDLCREKPPGKLIFHNKLPKSGSTTFVQEMYKNYNN